jgi:hypothetical protein
MRKTCLSFVVLAACGGGGSGTVALADFPAEYGAVYCAKAVECCTTAELEEQVLSSSEEECNQVFVGLLGTLLLPVLEDGVEQGRLIYHGDRIGDCIDALDAMSCDDFNSALSGSGFTGCDDPFEPLVDVDGECGTDADCISGYCSGDSTDLEGNFTYGVCAVAPTAGQPCDDFHCADGAWCDSGTCAEPQADGAACSSRDSCASGACNEGTCGDSTVCDGV